MVNRTLEEHGEIIKLDPSAQILRTKNMILIIQRL